MKISRFLIGTGVVLALAFAVFAPNLIWLDRSSVALQNLGTVTLADVELRVCGSTVRVPEIGAGKTHLLFLPKCQSPTLLVVSGTGPTAIEACKQSVDASMHHVEILFASPREASCHNGNPPYQPLLLERAIRSIL